MSDSPVFQNAIAWGHHRLRGGLRSTLLQSIGFFVVVGGLILAATRAAHPRDVPEILYGWMIGLLALQVGILLIYGGSTVRNAIRKDVTTGMIASHRLMPISGTQAVAGYVLGACPQPLAVGLANLLLGIVVAGPANVSPAGWVAANGVLALFAVCAWVVIAAATLISPKSAAAMVVVFILLLLSGGFIMSVVPALTVICSPLVGSTIFGIVMKGASWSEVLHLSIIAQLMATGFFFVVGVRKYRREDVAAVTPLLGLAIVLFFTILSVLGIRYWAHLQPTISGIAGDMSQVQAVGSMTAGLIVSFLPLSATAWLQEDYRRRRMLRDPALGRRPLPCTVVAVVCALLIIFIPALTLGYRKPELLLYTGLCLAATLQPIAYLLRLIYRTRASSGVLVALWIGLAWVGPWVVSFAVLVAYGIDDASRVPLAWSKSEWIASFSPVGSLISIWTSQDRPYLLGLAFQAALALAMAGFYHRLRSSSDELTVPVTQ